MEKVLHLKIDGMWIPEDHKELKFVRHGSGTLAGADTYVFRGTLVKYGWGIGQIGGTGWACPTWVTERQPVPPAPPKYKPDEVVWKNPLKCCETGEVVGYATLYGSGELVREWIS